MAEAEFHEVLPVEKKNLFNVVVDYAKYPDFVEGCIATEVKREGSGKARVAYEIHILSKDFKYVLDHTEDEKTGRVTWDLVESNLFKKNKGYWEIKPAGSGKSDVLYKVEVEFKIAVPGFLLNRLVKNSLPTLIKNFEKKAAT